MSHGRHTGAEFQLLTSRIVRAQRSSEGRRQELGELHVNTALIYSQCLRGAPQTCLMRNIYLLILSGLQHSKLFQGTIRFIWTGMFIYRSTRKEGSEDRNKLNRGHFIIVSLQQADSKMRRWPFAAWIYKIIFQIYIPTFLQNLEALYAAF